MIRHKYVYKGSDAEAYSVCSLACAKADLVFDEHAMGDIEGPSHPPGPLGPAVGFP
ncbi:MAG: hypothetical protein ABI599_11250 [Flavobacteriales bacterium]